VRRRSAAALQNVEERDAPPYPPRSMLTGRPPPSKKSALACSATALVVLLDPGAAVADAPGPSDGTSCELDAAIERSMAHDWSRP